MIFFFSDPRSSAFIRGSYSWRGAGGAFRSCILVTLLFGCAKEAGPDPRVVIHPAEGEPVAVRVEVADTLESRSLGLMFRRELDDDQGMIFFFEKDADHSFWMKNTPLSLDMIFISADGRVVGIARNTEPFSLRGVRVGKPSRAVLEVRAGVAKRHGLAPGDRVTYEGIDSPLLPEGSAAAPPKEATQTP